MKDNKNYVKVYFRIDNAYDGNYGWHNQEDENNFKQECKDLFNRLGFVIKEGRSSGCCDSVYGEGLNYLYLHPQNFSGVLEANDELQEKNDINNCSLIQQIGEMVKSQNYKQIKLRWIDFGIRKDFRIDEVVKNYTEEELLEALNGQKESIINQIFLKTTTPRSNLYKNYSYELVTYKYYKLNGINIEGDYEQEKKLEKVINKFFCVLFEELIKDGKLKVINSDRLIQNLYNVKHYRELLRNQPPKTLLSALMGY